MDDGGVGVDDDFSSQCKQERVQTPRECFILRDGGPTHPATAEDNRSSNQHRITHIMNLRYHIDSPVIIDDNETGLNTNADDDEHCMQGNSTGIWTVS